MIWLCSSAGLIISFHQSFNIPAFLAVLIWRVSSTGRWISRNRLISRWMPGSMDTALGTNAWDFGLRKYRCISRIINAASDAINSCTARLWEIGSELSRFDDCSDIDSSVKYCWRIRSECLIDNRFNFSMYGHSRYVNGKSFATIEKNQLISGRFLERRNGSITCVTVAPSPPIGWTPHDNRCRPHL